MDITYVSNRKKFNYRVCAIIISNNKILAMHDERSPYFYLPGGRVQMGETAEHAVVREVEEEEYIIKSPMKRIHKVKTAVIVKENADMMSVTQIHQKLEKGYADIEKGNVEDAASAFVAFRERH